MNGENEGAADERKAVDLPFRQETDADIFYPDTLGRKPSQEVFLRSAQYPDRSGIGSDRLCGESSYSPDGPYPARIAPDDEYRVSDEIKILDQEV
jgi:hypothetical protein